MIESQRVDEQAYQAAIGFLYERINYERMASGTARYPFRLQRTDQLLSQLGLGSYLNGQTSEPKVPIVHIAGTKGKGSTSAMVASGLTAAGLKTGLYTSPHLNDLEERFQIDGQPCERADLVALVNEIKPVCQAIAADVGREPSFFELTTAIALLHFDTSACDAIVLEVGLGGRLDSTNVCAPSVTAITSIGLDHQHVLGESLGEIATEKAGIIKTGIPVVSGVPAGEADDAIEQRAKEMNAPLYRIDRDFSVLSKPHAHWGVELDYRGTTEPLAPHHQISLSLDGKHQAHNAAIALSIIDVLRDQGSSIDLTNSRQGISAATCPGRIERFDLPDDVIAIVDAAHNADSINALCGCVQDRAGGRPIAVVFGTSRDKDAQPMLERLSQVADHLLLTQFEGNPRFTPTDELLELMPADKRDTTQVVQRPLEACQAALARINPAGVLVVCGSFFLAAETRQWMAARALSK